LCTAPFLTDFRRTGGRFGESAISIGAEMNAKPAIRNKTWSELKVGDSASLERTCAVQDLFLFAHASGNTNPLMLPSAEGSPERSEPVAPSMWVGSLVSAVLGNILPGPGTLYRSQDLRFLRRVHVGDKVKITVVCHEKRAEPIALFDTWIEDALGRLVCEGIAEIEAPTVTQTIEARDLPTLIVDSADHFGRLIALAAKMAPLRTAVVCPEDHNSLSGVLLSAKSRLIEPILIGDPRRIEEAAKALDADISGFALVALSDPHAAAARAVAMVLEGKANAVMKGAIHSDALLAEVVRKDGGLRTARRISHAFALDVPTLDEIVYISDAAINIAPDLMTKVDIVQNAIDLARACGLEKPRVGILSAVETINPAIPSTLDAAVLSKMAERGQIRDAVVDGPLAMDNAIDMEAARTKGIASLVAGKANVLIVPNLEAGNMLAKELTFVARAETAGLVLGAKAPVILTSRADNDRARLASCALAQLYEYYRREGHAFGEPSGIAKAAE
jgi:phosphotransacetylase/acyl dehydratase